MIESFNGIFDQKLKRIKKRLKEHLSNTKSKRDKQTIKNLIKEAKELRNILKKSKNEQNTIICPHCGGLINQGDEHE